MAFLLDGKTIQQGVAFTDADGNQYPANWLNLSSAEEKEAYFRSRWQTINY